MDWCRWCRLEFCLVFSIIVFQASPAENVWPPRSKSARFQVFALLFYVRSMTLVQAWICRRYRASRPQAKDRRCYLSQNIGPAVAGSAGPAPPPLLLLSQTGQMIPCKHGYIAVCMKFFVKSPDRCLRWSLLQSALLLASFVQ